MTDNPLRATLVAPEDLVIIPVIELPDEVRRQLGEGGEEFALTRPLARQPSKLIDACSARLIEQFRTPRTIVQAVLAYSRESNADPEATLEEALPLLHELLAGGLLVPEGAEGSHAIAASWASGAPVGRYRILRAIQVLDDSEIYQVRDAAHGIAVLKIARQAHAQPLQRRLDREAAALRRLEGVAAPRLLERGEIEGRPFLAMSWVEGADAPAAAAELREGADRRELLTLIRNVARAYAAIHRLGVLHGDVHPGNLLVGRDGAVALIDFGLATIEGLAFDPLLSGAVGFFMAPEDAQASLDRRPPQPTTPESEQFAVAALLFLVATGRHYMEFSLQQEQMFLQIRDARPLSFADCGAEAWPELERALRRALATEPARRYPDMTALAEALDRIEPEPSAPALREARGPAAFLDEVLGFTGLDGELYRAGPSQGPLCSINFGASGIAYALHRLACRRGDPRLLAAADAWIVRAAADREAQTAFYDPDMDLTEATVGRVSPYHTGTGLFLAQAMIAESMGEPAVRDEAVHAFLAAGEAPCPERDLCLGRTGFALGCALLIETLPGRDHALHPELCRAAEARLSDVWSEVATFEPLAAGRQWPNLGVAHGWAGLLYATFRLHALTGTPVPEIARERLAQLVDAARPTGRGATWPWRQRAEDDHSATMPGWCNGSAGMVHLAAMAHRALGDDALLEFGEAAAWHAWEGGEGPVDLCCGYAGRAYALLEMHRATGAPQWRDRARALMERAVRIAPEMRDAEHPRHSLYKGELGLALLIADMEETGRAAMPMFGPES